MEYYICINVITENKNQYKINTNQLLTVTYICISSSIEINFSQSMLRSESSKYHDFRFNCYINFHLLLLLFYYHYYFPPLSKNSFLKAHTQSIESKYSYSNTFSFFFLLLSFPLSTNLNTRKVTNQQLREEEPM